MFNERFKVNQFFTLDRQQTQDNRIFSFFEVATLFSQHILMFLVFRIYLVEKC